MAPLPSPPPFSGLTGAWPRLIFRSWQFNPGSIMQSPHHIDRQQRLAVAAIAGGATAIALAPIFVRLALVEGPPGARLGPTAIAFWRVMLSVPALAVWLALTAKPSPSPRLRGFAGWPGVALAGLFFAADLGCWHLSIKFTKVANATLLANFAPVFVTLFGWALFRLRPTRLFTLGLVLALAGAIVLMSGSLQLSRQFVTGDALGLITAIFYGSYILTVSRLRQGGQPVVRIMLGAALACSAALLPAALAMGERVLPPTPAAWAILVALALVSHVSGQGLITWALAHLPAAFSSVTLLLQPVLAAMFAWGLFGESLGALHLIGGLIVLAGITLARLGSLPAR